MGIASLLFHTLQLLIGCTNFSTPLQRLRLVHLLYPYLIVLMVLPFPKRSAPWLFTTAHLGGLMPSLARRHRWFNLTNGLHHLNYSMQYNLLPMHCFSAHYADVPTKGIKTIYTYIGDLFAWLCVIGLLRFIVIIIMSIN